MELGPIVLQGHGVKLEPLSRAHLDDLVAVAADPILWRWFPAALDNPDAMLRWIEEAQAAQATGAEYPFAVISLATGRAVGSTRYLDITSAHRGVEIGWTWYAASAWGTSVNPEAKLLLLRHAFEDWGAIRVSLKTDSLNVRSRAAILKLGAIYEGDLRNHRIRSDGTRRHSSYYSILDSEWPAVRAGLEGRLSVT